MHVLSIEATDRDTGAALFHAMSAFHPAIHQTDGDEGGPVVWLALAKEEQAGDVFAVLRRFLRGRAAEPVVVTLLERRRQPIPNAVRRAIQAMQAA